ncbi:MAG: anti-sigma factor family protein [Solirubrobacteraceae bacterium]
MPELALGIADGEQRALALEHIAGCSDCRRELKELSSLADDLIALAPQHDPPPGFEKRVLDRLAIRNTRPRRARRLRRLVFVAVVPAVAAATALAMTFVYSSDRRLASQYRAALQGAHGKYFQSAHLSTRTGQAAGIVFAYQGSPSWLFYTLDGRHSGGLYEEQIVTRSGKTITLPPFRLTKGSWGVATPIAVRDIARLTLTHQPRGPTLNATLPVVER